MISKVRKFTKILGLLALAGLSGHLEAQYTWSLAGPKYTAGRARNMVVDKNDPSGKTLYVGSTSSGIFKTTDGGLNWGPVNDTSKIRNISFMAQGSDGTIYAGTGEGYLRKGQRAKALPGTGLYKLSGVQLLQVAGASVTGTLINRVAISPANNNVIAITTNSGVLVSKDGGSTFSAAAGIAFNSGMMGMDAKFDNSGILYCSVGSPTDGATNTASTNATVWKSTDASLLNFVDITPTTTSLPDKNYGRIELAVAPSDNNVIYASVANKNQSSNPNASANLKALFVSYDAGQTWALVLLGSPTLDPTSFQGLLSYGDYSGVLMVSPSNKHQLFFGAYHMYIWTRTVGAGNDSDTNPIGTWTKVGNNFAINTPLYLHENIHDIKIINGNPAKFYFITDAGVFRSTDMTSTSQNLPPSFQPFYSGLVTGQFNSVSMQRFPIGSGTDSKTNGTKVTPFSGFIGGTGGNGLTFYSGTADIVTQESNYLSGDVYNAELSKILPNAAFATNGVAAVYRSSDVRNASSISAYSVNKYTGDFSKSAPTAEVFSNNGYSTGTPFKLWEYYGQFPVNPDKAVFYNDSLRFSASVATVTDLATTSTFTFAANRPNQYAMLDSIVIRTTTVALAQTSAAVAFNTSKTIYLSMNENYTNTSSVTVLTGSNVSGVGDISTAVQPTITLNNSTLADVISVTFLAPPFGDKTVASTNPGHYRVYATAYYRYKPGDQVVITDNLISTQVFTYSATFTTSASWRYKGQAPQYALNATPNAAVTNPTYAAVTSNAAYTSTSLPVNVRHIGVRTYTISQLGTYTATAKPVAYTLSVNTDTNVPGTTYTFEVQPGGQSVTAAASSTAAVQFTVIPAAATVYTITQYGSGTLTASSAFTVGASSYVLNPGNITQSQPVFSIAVTNSTSPQISYTLSGVSSNTAIGLNTSTTTAAWPIRSTATAGSTLVPFPPNNQPLKVPMRMSARLAMIANNGALTGNADAIVVSKNPLSLNDPGIFVRVSQTGCKTDDASGNPTENTINIQGKPTLLEWSKGGTEIYFATDLNKVYRVSHITEINDMSPSSYNGKFYNDVFAYNNSGPSSAALNPNSPFRTTLIGEFDAPVTGISVTNDDSKLLLTFNNPTAAGSTGVVMYSSNDVRTAASHAATGWVKKDQAPLTGHISYCSLLEKDDNKKAFVGTDEGLFYCSDITASTPVWKQLFKEPNSKLPNVQVFDIKQQVMGQWDCYNSGQIYVATNGRGVWTNTEYLKNFIVGVDEENPVKSSEYAGLKVFPNPTNSNFSVSFEGMAGESASLNVYDLSGRSVRSAQVGRIESSDMTYEVDVQGMNAGIYIVEVKSDNGNRKVAKLVVTK